MKSYVKWSLVRLNIDCQCLERVLQTKPFSAAIILMFRLPLTMQGDARFYIGKPICITLLRVGGLKQKISVNPLEIFLTSSSKAFWCKILSHARDQPSEGVGFGHIMMYGSTGKSLRNPQIGDWLLHLSLKYWNFGACHGEEGGPFV